MSALAYQHAPGLDDYRRAQSRKPTDSQVVEVAPKGTPCPNGNVWNPSCKKRSCRVCGGRWARDVYTVLRSALEEFGGPVTVIAITPPGADRLPWDEEHCKHRGPHKHAGKRGCRVQQRELREWSETLTWRAQKLRKAAYQALKRAGGDLQPPLWLTRGWEPQRRGAGHLHVVLPYGTFAEKRAAQEYAKTLARLAPNYDFGHVDKHLKAWTGADAARYLASYLTGRSSKKGKQTIRQNISDPNLPSSLVWVTPKLTRRTMVTMRSLRRARHLWACRRDPQAEPPRWTSATDAVRACAAFRRIYLKEPTEDGHDLEAAFPLAQEVDRELRRLDREGYVLDWLAQREHVREFAASLASTLLSQARLQAEIPDTRRKA